MPSLRIITYQPGFSGLHNNVKAKSWLVLYDCQLGGNVKGLTVRELAAIIGASRASLAVLLGRWRKWGYVGVVAYSRPRRYRIAERGRQWVDRWRDIMPLERFLFEIEAAQAWRWVCWPSGDGWQCIGRTGPTVTAFAEQPEHSIVVKSFAAAFAERNFRVGSRLIP